MEGAYYKTKESVEEFIRLAENVSGKQLIEKLEAVLAPDSEVLEIGSGPGTDWRILNESYQVIGSDNSKVFLDHLKMKNPKGEFLELDATTLKTEKRFNGIYSNKVLHHLTDADLEKSIQRQSEILHDDGVVCHSFWKGEGTEVFKGLFVNYHEIAGLRKLFEKHFEILSIDTYEEFEADDSILLMAKKKR